MTASVTYRWLSCTGQLYSKYKAPLPRICLVTVILLGDRHILGHYICTGLTVPLRKRTTRRAVNPIFQPVCATYSPSSRYRFPVRKLQLSKFRPKNWLNQWLQFALASIFPLRWVVCCAFTDWGLYIIKILNQRFYLATFVRFYLSSATFNTYDTIWNYATF